MSEKPDFSPEQYATVHECLVDGLNLGLKKSSAPPETAVHALLEATVKVLTNKHHGDHEAARAEFQALTQAFLDVWEHDTTPAND